MNRSRSLNPAQFFALFALCCLLPLAAAKLALSFSWFSPGVSNKGNWLEQELRLPVAGGLWQLLYVQPDQCARDCELALHSLQQLYVGLGAKSEQVAVGLIAAKAPAQLERFPALRWYAEAGVLPPLFRGQLLLVDRQGQLLLHYDAVTSQQQAMTTAKKMRADLLRLLAFDRPHKASAD